jgi:hypothetical protein
MRNPGRRLKDLALLIGIVEALQTPHSRDLRSRCPTAVYSALFAKAPSKRKSSGGSSAALKGFGSAVKNLAVPVDNSPTTRAFFQYLDANEAGDNLQRTSLGDFAVDSDNKIRGAVALKDMKQGDDIINIPYELAINLGPQGQDPTVPAVHLLRSYCECHNDSTTQGPLAYYKMLPTFQSTDCRGSTDFFSDAALNALQSPLIVEETLQRRELTRQRFETDIAAANSNFPSWIDGSPVTLEHLAWAVWIITSRVLTVQGDDGQSYRLLIPYLDMCNHDRASKHVLTGRACTGGQLKVVAGSTVKAGTQVTIAYGVAGNDRFVQDYGFLDRSTPEGFRLVAQQLLGKVRIREGKFMNKLIPEEERDRTLQRLRESTTEQDEELLRTESDPQIRLAIEYRLGLKQALSAFIDIE